MSDELVTLREQISKCIGSDPELDQCIAEVLDSWRNQSIGANYTSSVDACIALIDTLFPGSHWHIGRGAQGIMPYATIRFDAGENKDRSKVISANGPTVPLALLGAIVQAKQYQDGESIEFPKISGAKKQNQ